MGDVITLHHGSSYDFDSIDLRQGGPYKDFGQGFYASADIGQAKSMAERNAEMRKSRLMRFDQSRKLIGKWLYQYEFDTGKAALLAVKRFAEVDREWGRFITINRSRVGLPHKFDVVIGPTANDYADPAIQ
ncbi:MAG: DUF3990 domain-containing protein, partial [Deltaproteobacteria bacterium]|nr:DUF3990 domain-containing protein [Deltaproteobacteria bacterium]